MKKVLIFLMAVSLFAACNNDKNAKKRDKDPMDNREKDDYRNDDKEKDKPNADDRDRPVDDAKDDNKSGTWSKSDENRFMDDCEGTAEKNVGAARANEYCDCMLQKIKKMYSSYVEADRELAGSSQTELNRLASECNGQ